MDSLLSKCQHISESIGQEDFSKENFADVDFFEDYSHKAFFGHACIILYSQGSYANMATTITGISQAQFAVKRITSYSDQRFELTSGLKVLQEVKRHALEMVQLSCTATMKRSRREFWKRRHLGSPCSTCMILDWSSLLSHTMAAESYKCVKQIQKFIFLSTLLKSTRN